MNTSPLSWLLTPVGIISIIVALIVLAPIIKWLVWKLFAFDRRVDRILTQKKSSEVRLGKIAESIAPLLEGFPVDINKPGTSTVFIGQPVDFVHFDPETGVTFIEVKSGQARLSSSQRQLKQQIEAGNVFWELFQVK